MTSNRAPIFVNGFSRGGTTILTNLLASHRNVGLLGETHHLFKGTHHHDSRLQILFRCLCYDAPVMFCQRQDFFSPRLMQPRRKVSSWTRRLIDAVLTREEKRLIRRRAEQDLLPREDPWPVEATGSVAIRGEHPARAGQFRLLGKNIDGMIYATDAWREIYPEATFIGLVRNGLAICEGHIRRGRSPEEIGWRYDTLVNKMLDDAARLPRYRILRFEDIIRSPWDALRTAYAVAGLDENGVSKIRMQTRRVMDAHGVHRLHAKSEWELIWLSRQQLSQYLHRDVDDNQIRRLTPIQRDAFLKRASRAMERLGYATDYADGPAHSISPSGKQMLSVRRTPPRETSETRRRAA